MSSTRIIRKTGYRRSLPSRRHATHADERRSGVNLGAPEIGESVLPGPEASNSRSQNPAIIWRSPPAAAIRD